MDVEPAARGKDVRSQSGSSWDCLDEHQAKPSVCEHIPLRHEILDRLGPLSADIWVIDHDGDGGGNDVGYQFYGGDGLVLPFWREGEAEVGDLVQR